MFLFKALCEAQQKAVVKNTSRCVFVLKLNTYRKLEPPKRAFLYENISIMCIELIFLDFYLIYILVKNTSRYVFICMLIYAPPSFLLNTYNLLFHY